MTATEIDRVHAELVAPIASDLELDVYDIERRGATMRITLDTPPGSEGGITLDSLSLATRLISRELDHEDPIAGHYTLEVTSPGLERQLRTPAHFQREVGKTITVRFRDPKADPRRVARSTPGRRRQHPQRCSLDDGIETHVRRSTTIDKARTVFEWGPKPKPGRQPVRQEVGRDQEAVGQEDPGDQPSTKPIHDTRSDIEQGEATVMSNLDMSEAIGMLAQEKGISEDTLLHVLVDALASAYKRRPDAADEVVVEVNPETMEFSFIAYDVDEDGNWVNERDDTPKKEELGRIAAQTFRQVMSQRIREVESERKFEEYANREGDIVTGIIQRTDARYTLLDLGRVRGAAAAGRAGAVRASRPGRPSEGLHRRSAPHAEGPADRRVPHAPGSHQAPVRARSSRDRRRHRRDQGLRP